jgi:serine/threonine protein kinase
MTETLEHLLDRSPLNAREAIVVLQRFAEGLQIVHQSGDLWDQSESSVVFDCDFTVLKIGTSRETSSRVPPGKIDATRSYVAPEYLTNGNEDARSDIWVWGRVAYELVTGKNPFQGATVGAIMAATLKSEPLHPASSSSLCSQALGDIILRALHREPEKRVQSASELQEALEGLTC